MDFTLKYRYARAFDAGTDGKHCTDNRNGAVFRRHIKMAVALLRRFDDDAAAAQIDTDPVMRADQRQL